VPIDARWRSVFRIEVERDPAAPSVNTALVLVAVWLVASLIVAAGFSERAEITG
jgi:hypothetical protein